MSPIVNAYLDDPRNRLYPRLRVEGECLVWTGYRNENGYGCLTVEKRRVQAHRFAWELAYGEIPEGLQVLHSCDNPPCCNVRHLFLGTQADNNRDMVQKGRHWAQRNPERASKAARGERNGFAKLSDAAVREIRTTTTSVPVLAKRFGVSKSHIYRVRRGASRGETIR